MKTFREYINLVESAEQVVAEGDLEVKHKSFNQFVDCGTIQHALFRDWPDQF